MVVFFAFFPIQREWFKRDHKVKREHRPRPFFDEIFDDPEL